MGLQAAAAPAAAAPFAYETAAAAAALATPAAATATAATATATAPAVASPSAASVAASSPYAATSSPYAAACPAGNHAQALAVRDPSSYPRSPPLGSVRIPRADAAERADLCAEASRGCQMCDRRLGREGQMSEEGAWGERDGVVLTDGEAVVPVGQGGRSEVG